MDRDLSETGVARRWSACLCVGRDDLSCTCCFLQIACEGHEAPPDSYAVYLFYMRVMRASAEIRADEEARS